MSSNLTPQHRLWRLLPVGPRRQLIARIAALAAPGVDHTPPSAGEGVIVAGELSRASGLGEGARLMLRSLASLGVPVWPLDIGPLLPAHSADLPPPQRLASEPPPGAALVLHVNAPWLPLVLARLPRALLRSRRTVGFWAWELAVTPPNWSVGARFVHEVWVPSRFTAKSLAPLVSGRIRVVPHPLAAEALVPSPLGRAFFGLPEDAIVVLVSFNLASSFERKNPLGSIEAFHAAFGERRDRILLLKVTNPHHFPADFKRLTSAVAGVANIRLETRTLPHADTLALTATADIVLSLHRSEAFGISMAEAMLLGKPVIATGWSGNMDFMDAGAATLVPHQLIPVQDARRVYEVPGAVWADPDIAYAAAWLRRLASDPAARRSIGDAGRTAASIHLGTAPLADAVRTLAAAVSADTGWTETPA